ncbi:trypsin-like peptidase domain-containing protein [Mesorhizobium sp.]|uniref:trypsin-like peptidase domain-containing protein n=1 Tax=Mesorhizobium sp. TaxID=1871066 RepID=UPI0025C30BED|nr:trypsin-like peptidase domain-containing protein [Mesorhizobium sp.]
MADSAQEANLSFEQQMAVERPDAGPVPKSAADWGIKDLAILPGDVQKTRRLRSPKFEGLPAGASTMFEQLSVTLEQVVGSNDLRPAWWLEEGAARSRAVCKIDASGVDYKGRSGTWSGSGFLVAPGILCTNHHVLNSKEVAARSRALFDFAALPDGTVRQVSTFRLRPDLLFWTSPVVATGGKGGLDVTFVALEGQPGSTFGSIPLLRQAFVVADEDKLNVIQHPNGRLKEVAIRNNTVVFQNTQVVQYQSDTEAGSSGAPVMNDGWELVALHHAAKKDKSNEGIKFSAIAAALELEAQTGNADAARLFELFTGTDELAGFFGTLGRAVVQNDSGMERVVDAYNGEDQDLDIGFWNIEWFNKRWQDKLDSVARIIVEMNLDVWVFVESSLEATEALARHLETSYQTKSWGVLASQDAASERQITTVMWNKSSVGVAAKTWPDKVERWFQVDSRQFDDLGLEAVHGKVFDRYPALYEVTAKIHGMDSTFNLVPIHLKAKDEGSLRRQMAARLLAEAVAELAQDPGFVRRPRRADLRRPDRAYRTRCFGQADHLRQGALQVSDRPCLHLAQSRAGRPGFHDCRARPNHRPIPGSVRSPPDPLASGRHSASGCRAVRQSAIDRRRGAAPVARSAPAQRAGGRGSDTGGSSGTACRQEHLL